MDSNLVGEEAPETPAARGGRPPSELRIALAMRGGVSLAVWIGGAVAELDLARQGLLFRDTPEALGPPESPTRARALAYARLLESAGFSSLGIDVLAGASAGGLNAVVYGFAQSVGTTLDELRGVWESEGDLWNLLHEQRGPGDPLRTPALLRGDAVFYEAMLARLLDMAEAAKEDPHAGARKVGHLTIDLSATLQGGPPLPDRRTGADLRPHTAHFRFRKTPSRHRWLNDMPDSADDLDAIRRLAYAARSTSSFPGAFEPAAVFSWGSEELESPDLNMRAVFSEVGESPEIPFDVMDGGVFDNIPISRAITAIADAPAESATRRILIYLDPSPPEPEQATVPVSAYTRDDQGRRIRAMRSRFITSALRAVRYKQTTESSADDLAELNRLRADGHDTRRRRRAFLTALPASMTAYSADRNRFHRRYGRYRAQADAARLGTLLTEPGVGFLRALVDGPEVTCAVHPDEEAEVVSQIAVALKDLGPRCLGDAVTLGSATDLFIAWMRIEQDRRRETTPEHLARLGEAKSMLYRVRTLAQYTHDRQERRAVKRALMIGTQIDPAAIASALWPDMDRAVDPSVDLSTDAGLWQALANGASRRTHELGGLVASGWACLCAAVNSLTPDPRDNPVLVALAAPDGLTADLAHEVTMAATLSIGSLASSAVPRFYTFSGNQLHPVDGLPAVTDEQLALTLDEAVTTESVESLRAADGVPMSARSKLAGNNLANFAGFLAAGWRTHDWDWGRADAAAAFVSTLVDLGADPGVGSEARANVDAMLPPLDRRKAGLSDLTPQHRFALATRALLGVQRVLWPLTPRSHRPTHAPSDPARTVVVAVVLMLLRPVLVLVPLVAHPAALGWSIILVLVTHHLTAGDAVGRASIVAATALTATLLVLRFVTLGKRRRRWALAADELSTVPDSRWAELAASVVARIGREIAVTIVIGTLVAAALLIPGTRERITVIDVVAMAAVLVFAVIDASRISAARVSRSRDKRWSRIAWHSSAVVGIVPVLTIVTIVLGLLLDEPWRTAQAVAIATTALVWVIHHAWSPRGVPLLTAVPIGVAAAGLSLAEDTIIEWIAELSDSRWVSSTFPWAIAAVAIGTVWLLDVVGSRSSALGRLTANVVMTAVATASGWLVTGLWGWHEVIPSSVIIACAASAATTMFVPFRRSIDPAL